MELINEAQSTFSKIKQLFPFDFSPFQDKALDNILKKNNVLITAHTGSGKTVPAEAAFLYYCKMKGKKAKVRQHDGAVWMFMAAGRRLKRLWKNRLKVPG